MKKNLALTALVLLIIETQAQQPSITSFSPTSGSIGTQVTIVGTNFSTASANNHVYFGAVKATVATATSTSLIVTVPNGANFQPVSVAVNNLIGYSKMPFIVTYPAGGLDFTGSSFAPAVGYTGRGFVAEGDIDTDGKPDVIYTNFPDNFIGIGRNTSYGATVSFAYTIIGGVVNPISVKTADLNADGLLDLVVANPTFNLVYVLKNNSSPGTISFSAPVSLATGAEPRKLAIADIDNDGKADIITANQSANSISVLRNTSAAGNISFTAKIDFATAATPEGICTGYLDNDDKTDIMVACSGANAISVFKNTSIAGTISLNAKTDYGAGVYPWDVATADLDGDGKPELASTNLGSSNVSVLRNTSTAGISFAAKVDFSTTYSPRGIAINDLNADGKPDIVTANWYSSSQVCVLKNNSVAGSLSFQTAAYATSNGSGNPVVADFNGDGLADIITANSTNLSFLKNQLPIPTGIPLCPSLLTPADNATNIAHGIPLEFKWRKDANATGYRLKITPQAGTATEITTTDTNYMFTPAAGTSYTWTVTPQNMIDPGTICNAYTFNTCATIANNVTISAVGATDKCGTDSVLLKASSSSNLQWFINGSSIPGATADSIWARQAGNYSVRILVGACYTDPSNTITINNLATPAKPTLNVAGATTFCEGGVVTLSSSLANHNNQWFKNAVALSGANGDNYTANEAGSFYLKVTDSNTGCPNYSDTISVKVNAIPATPAITIISGTTSFCETTTIKMSSSASTGNQWYKDNVLIPGVTAREYNTARSGNYTVRVTVNNCTSDPSDGINVTVHPLPPKPTITRVSGTWPFCMGDSATISSSATTGNQWYKDGVAILSAISQQLVIKETGKYSVSTTSPEGCTSASLGWYNGIALPVPATPVISIVSGTTTFCEPETIKLSSSADTANQWYINNVLIPGATGKEYTSAQTGNYTVRVTDGTCYSLASVGTIVTVYPVPSRPIITKIAGTATFCIGDSVILSSSATIGNQWFKNNVAIAGAVNQMYTAKETADYMVKTTQNGCESSLSDTLKVKANILPAKPIITATGNSLSTSSGYAGYKWYLNNSLISGANNQQYDVRQSGIYKVEVTDNNGCKNFSDDFNVVYTALNDITVGGYAIQIYPNPVIEDVFIKVSSTNWAGNKLYVLVTDINGKILQTVYLRPGSNMISLKNYVAGVYTFILRKDNIRKAVKILKIR
ncbi:FG-GAP-like repeat-containing protein [Terrimonas pollutisoli]|uniref:FG-GAP-like repeat-containing protein n=1 Tax=Terrimonas pollutisoli TaxID=3034147 RepID=UPI0023EC7D65|nr:FG-GAP-like repeat-containing protein [Terrimonas sp. H1YJ31]